MTNGRPMMPEKGGAEVKRRRDEGFGEVVETGQVMERVLTGLLGG